MHCIRILIRNNKCDWVKHKVKLDIMSEMDDFLNDILKFRSKLGNSLSETENANNNHNHINRKTDINGTTPPPPPPPEQRILRSCPSMTDTLISYLSLTNYIYFILIRIRFRNKFTYKYLLLNFFPGEQGV